MYTITIRVRLSLAIVCVAFFIGYYSYTSKEMIALGKPIAVSFYAIRKLAM